MISQTIPDVTTLDIRNSIKYKIFKGTDNKLVQVSFKIFHIIMRKKITEIDKYEQKLSHVPIFT